MFNENGIGNQKYTLIGQRQDLEFEKCQHRVILADNKFNQK
jgi:hypothetical protein